MLLSLLSLLGLIAFANADSPTPNPYSTGFYLAIALPPTSKPTGQEVQALATATEDYVNISTMEMWWQRWGCNVSLQKFRYDTHFPSKKFNLLMEFTVSLSFHTSSPSETEIFQALQDILSSNRFLSRFVRTSPGFDQASAVAVDAASLIPLLTSAPTPAPMTSTVPSQIPYASGLWSLEPFYLAIALPSTIKPTGQEVQALAATTEDYVNLSFDDLYAPSYGGGYVSLQTFRYDTDFPSKKFNLLMEFTISVAFYSGMPGAPPTPSEKENFLALKDILSSNRFLSQFVHPISGFDQASAVAVDAASLIPLLTSAPTPAPMTSTVPSQIPYASGLWSLEPFYLAIALPSTIKPTGQEVQALAATTEDYVNLSFDDLYAPSYGGGYVSLQTFRYDTDFPSKKFNLLMEFTISVAFYSGMPGAPPTPSEKENFLALKDILSSNRFLSQFVHPISGFDQASAVAVDAASLIPLLTSAPTPAPMTSMVPSQPFDSGVQSLEPFYLAIALPSTSKPTDEEIQALVRTINDFVNLSFDNLYAPSYGGNFASLQRFRYDVHFPESKFNLLMEFTISMAFYPGIPGAPPTPSEKESFIALKDMLSSNRFLSQFLLPSAGFDQATVVAVDATSLIPRTIPRPVPTRLPTSAPTTNTCSCGKSDSIDSSLMQAQSAIRIWVQYEMTTLIKAADGYLYYQGYVNRWFKNGNNFGKGKLIIKTHSSMDSIQCGEPLAETKLHYILFGTVTTQTVPGFAGPTTVFSFDNCAPPRLASSLTKGEWQTLFK